MTTGWTYDPRPPRPDWGVRAPTLKTPSTRQRITPAPLPAQAAITLAQGTGPPAEPLVTRGEKILTGGVIGVSTNGLTVHSSITGIVLAVELHPVPGAVPTLAPCVVVQRQGEDQYPAGIEPVAETRLKAEEICARIAAGGIVGLGGALFPTAEKIAVSKGVHALIVNGAECEPWISCDEMLMRERAASIITGTRILMRALDTGNAIVAVEADKVEARVAIADAIRASGDDRIGISVVTAKYPAGGERQLIAMITGNEVPAGGLPRDVGYVCQNVGTAAAVAQLFRTGLPLISRIVTVTGSAIAKPGNFEVRIGTPLRDLIALAGGYLDEPQRLLMGGPMMGFALSDDDLPVTKATNCIVAASADEIAPEHEELPCIRCGDCVEVCPARLMPLDMFTAIRRGCTEALLDELGLFDCIECGSCDYVCPSYIRLVSRFIAAKESLHGRRPRAGAKLS